MSELLSQFQQTYDKLLTRAENRCVAGDLDMAAGLLRGAIDLAQTHLHGLIEDGRVDQLVAGLATRAFGPRRVRQPKRTESLRVGFLIRHLLDHRGGGKSWFFIADGLRRHGCHTFFYVPEATSSNLEQRVAQSGIPVRMPIPDSRPLARARVLRQWMAEDEIDIVFNYDMGDWLGGELALLGGDVPMTIFHHNTDHLFSVCVHSFECHLALRQTTLRPCRNYNETAYCACLPLPGSLHAGAVPPVSLTRAALGIPDDAIVTVTTTTLSKLVNSVTYFECLDEVLERHPQTHHVLIGGGDPQQTEFVQQQVARMRAAKRVYSMGRRENVPSLLRLADIFIDSHPIGGFTACLEAMQAGLPVLTLSEGRDPIFSGESALELPDCIAPTRAEFVARLERLVTDATWRRELGGQLRDIYARKYDPDVAVAQYAAFLRALPGEVAARSVTRSANTGQRFLYPVQLGNPNERRPLDYVADAFDIASAGSGLGTRSRMGAQFAAAFPGLLAHRRFWGAAGRRHN